MSVSHLYVLPQSLKDSRPPWAFARISLRNGPSQAKHLDLCWPLYNMQGIVSGKRMQRPPGIVCGAARVLEDMVTRHHVPLLLSSDNSMQASVAMLPTQAGMGDLCVLRLAFHGNGLCQVIQPDSCFHAPHSFIGSIGTSAHAVDRSSISIVKDSKGPARRASVIAHSAASRKTRLVCQNSLSPELSSLSELRFFVTHDPRSLASWLSLSRVQLTGGLQLVGSSSPSQPVNIRVTVLLSCDIYSCIGCPPGRAQALCLSAQQCRIERCVGSPVDMRSPLCNTGITMQKIMESYITAALGGWIVFVETYSSALQLAFETDDVRQLRIESLDDAFFSQICTAKDLAASGTAVITSFVNKVVMGVGEPLTYDANRRMQASGDLAVGKFGMQSTMIAHGINGMLYQLTLLPLFLLVGVQKVYVCGGRQVMAAISTVSPGFEVTLGRADLQRASDRVTGSCVASFATRCVDSMGEAGSEDCVVGASSGILSAMQSFSVGIMSWIGPSGVPLDTLLHTMDASISFMEGFVTSLQALVQVVDTENCKAPDFFAHKVVKCACGDDPVRIPAANRSQGLADFAHWCSGTLQIPTVAGDFVYVLNPFSYEEITSRLGSGNLDDYLQCISGSPGSVSTRSCHTLLNSFQEFSDQQISPLSVLQACRDNYHAGRWDPGAWVLYDEESLRAKADGRLLSTMTPASIDDRGRRADSPVGRCLLDAGRRGEPPTLCMQEHLATTSANAFRYHSLSAEEARLDDSLLVDACVVFSGPARDPRELSAPFKACADGFTENGCRIPAIAWSVGSRNNVPVAREHVVDSLTSQGRTQVADAAQADAQSLVVPLLQGLLDFEDENLEVLLFSADGDALHQGFDCFVMGPYSRIDFWAGARSHALAVPFWARDAGGEGESRSMDLPCSLEKLQGDHLPPFTCGSPTRRSIIKSFVRGLVGDKKKGEVTLLEKLVQVRAMIPFPGTPRPPQAAAISVWRHGAPDAAHAMGRKGSPSCLRSGGTVPTTSASATTASARGMGRTAAGPATPRTRTTTCRPPLRTFPSTSWRPRSCPRPSWTRSSPSGSRCTRRRATRPS